MTNMCIQPLRKIIIIMNIPTKMYDRVITSNTNKGAQTRTTISPQVSHIIKTINKIIYSFVERLAAFSYYFNVRQLSIEPQWKCVHRPESTGIRLRSSWNSSRWWCPGCCRTYRRGGFLAGSWRQSRDLVPSPGVCIPTRSPFLNGRGVTGVARMPNKQLHCRTWVFWTIQTGLCWRQRQQPTQLMWKMLWR